jgi:UDP-N-acetylglucosamine diphosphorylase / glucose-1-phosphate thymidylyltransferase / UDP-N-acetylgalactosamine diphosphorylase / glucosamine-1-phosphate N-acetyltransferase / galactosamine-1-phosphate N-acetyltransferase
MLKIILTAPHIIKPFNERARDLRIQNQPLWLHQRNVLAPYVTSERELESGKRLPLVREPVLVYRDNLYFDEHYIAEFMAEAKKRNALSELHFRSTTRPFVSMLFPFRHPIPLLETCS